MSEVIFTIYNISDGSHFGEAKGDPETWVLPEGQAIYRGTFDYLTHKIGPDGEPVEIVGGYRPGDDELNAMINRERQRRIEAGKDFYGVVLTGSDRDQVNLLALKDTARDLIAADITAAIIPFRDGNNVEHMLTAEQIVDLANEGKTYVSAIYQASWTLKAMDPIPQDVTNDAYWP